MTNSTWKIRYAEDFQISRPVKIWLITGLVMIFLQIFIGGVTRLTGSGLSITRWEIVTGSIPPLNETEWTTQFELYKQTPQYQKINQGMSLGDFKFIFFWEYFHRLWARLMFFVFVFPFGWFLTRGMLSRSLLPRMLMVVALAGLEGFFGWAMVASGLIKRPWVNAYNLTLHLCMALVIFSYLLWTAFIAHYPKLPSVAGRYFKNFAWLLFGIAFFQIALGAMMSGSKAGLFFPTWPDMNGEYFPNILMDVNHWESESFIQYDTNPFMPALIQFMHRNTAYLLSILVLFFAWKTQKAPFSPLLKGSIRALLAVLGVQVALGIFTIINCKSRVPVDLGVAHQAGAVILLSVLLFVCFQLNGRNSKSLL